DKYRITVMILADGMLGQMMEPLEFDEDIQPSGIVEKPWVMTGAKARPGGSIKSLFLKGDSLEQHNEALQEKYRNITNNEKRSETYKAAGADIIIVSYGTIYRIACSCVDKLRQNGIKAGAFRPITLWPFPSEEIKSTAKKNTQILVVEMSAGQMVEDVRLAIQDDERIKFLGRMGGGIPSEEEIVKEVNRLVGECRRGDPCVLS
ncbi:MAG: 3-methyl-2-oxobutanoate dehydrogenase subunit beta, partial [Candidatus Omnitrophica bacterium]|nr:3-methyl-2-oxobutanoate dehydrogenase subunit beta [Candidatus Omnitrophota bacterium]